jgi:tetratricopeptide (TPR) repeat protein
MTAPRALVAMLCLGLSGALALPAWAGPIEDGHKALKERRFAEAAEAFEKVLDSEKSGRAAALGLARAATQGRLVERLDAAEVAVTRWVKAKEDDAEARVALGEVFLALAPTKTDDKAKEFTFRDAQIQFEKALAVTPDLEEAVAGLAQVHWQMGAFDTCLEVADAALEKRPSAKVFYWQGQAYYEQARAGYAAEPTAERTTALFRKAKGAYMASLKLDAGSFDAWMQHGYASQYLGQVDDALSSYEKAMGLDPESRFPLLGIDAVMSRDQASYVKMLTAIAERLPANVAVHYFLGFAHFNANRWEPAVAALSTYVRTSRRPEQPAFLLLGRALAQAGKEPEALKAFEKALALNPRDRVTAYELDQRLQAKHARAAAESPSNARACEDDYEKLAALAPENPLVLQNGAFILREAYVRHQGDAGWVPVVKASARLYERAAKLIDDLPYDVLEGAAWGERYAWAQITSDTGLMFQFYPPTLDLEKAEGYYLRALKLVNDGYFDAWNNLHKLYLGQKQFQKAYDLAARAAEGLALESGDPHTTGRAQARAEMARLLAEGKAKAE